VIDRNEVFQWISVYKDQICLYISFIKLDWKVSSRIFHRLNSWYIKWYNIHNNTYYSHWHPPLVIAVYVWFPLLKLSSDMTWISRKYHFCFLVTFWLRPTLLGGSSTHLIPNNFFSSKIKSSLIRYLHSLRLSHQ
jgi:hypothetical protein